MPAEPPKRTPKRDQATAALIVAFCLYLAFRARAFTLDDGAIVTRYVRNLDAGNGWTWNSGVHFNGITSAAYTIVVSLINAPIQDAHFSQHLVSGIFSAVAGIAAWRLLTSSGTPKSVALAAGFLVPAMPAVTHTWGLETPMYLALLLLTPQLDGKRLWFAIGLAPLVRPDGLIQSAFSTVKEVARTRRISKAGVAIAAATLLPWLVFSRLYFGLFVPSTVSIKAQQGQGATGGFTYAAGWKNELLHWTGQSKPLAVALVVVAALGLALAVYDRRWKLVDVSVVVLLQQLAFYVVKVPSYRWYYVPLLMLITLLGLYAVGRVLPELKVVPIAVGVATLALLVSYVDRDPVRQDLREQDYQDLSARIKTLGQGSVICSEVGTLGADLPLTTPVIDISGLTTSPVIAGANAHLFWDHPSRYFVFHWFTDRGADRAATKVMDAIDPRLGPGTPFGSETPFVVDPRFTQRYHLVSEVSRPPYATMLLFEDPSITS